MNRQILSLRETLVYVHLEKLCLILVNTVLL